MMVYNMGEQKANPLLLRSAETKRKTVALSPRREQRGFTATSG
jgi:hypothetical protein